MLRWDWGRGRQSDRQAENEQGEQGGTRALRKEEKDGNIIQRELGTCGWEAESAMVDCGFSWRWVLWSVLA